MGEIGTQFPVKTDRNVVESSNGVEDAKVEAVVGFEPPVGLFDVRRERRKGESHSSDHPTHRGLCKTMCSKLLEF